MSTDPGLRRESLSSGARMGRSLRAQVVVVGSGAGGGISAAFLAEAGYDVVLLEEGDDIDTTSVQSNSTEALSTLYRNGGLTPILGNLSMAYVEGCCVGGSTEINSGFWHRLPPDSYSRWRADYLLDAFTPETMDDRFARIEEDLSVSKSGLENESHGSRVFRRGIEELGWRYEEVPRCMKNPTGSPFAPGMKQSVRQTYVPRAINAGAKLISGCKVGKVRVEEGRAVGVEASVTDESGTIDWTIRADLIFICCGAVQTPALLRRSGIRKNVGNTLRMHPMIKAAALFDEDMGSFDAPIPVYQVKDFWPTVTLGGSVITPGYLAMHLADNWRSHQEVMEHYSQMGLYHAASRGLNCGTVRAVPGTRDGVLVRYRVNRADQHNLSVGLGHLGEVLFAAGARAVYPSLRSYPALRSVEECRSFLKSDIPVSDMSLSTVHVFSSCPMGENPDVCATDSFGRVRGFSNLYLNDASLLPDSPGVNPQGSTMAIALRNVEHFLDDSVRTRRSPKRGGASKLPQPDLLLTGATGWLGMRLTELLHGDDEVGAPRDFQTIRCLVPHGVDPSPLTAFSDNLQVVSGDLRDGNSLEEFFDGAAGAAVIHAAGIIHPQRTSEFEKVNVEGTRSLLRLSRSRGVKRFVAVSSNSAIGCNPKVDHLFDESSPYDPYMGYGRSKEEMERLVAKASESGEIETVVVRAPWFYGPRQPERQTQFFKMIKSGWFPLLGDGSQRRSMAYVDNLCQGLLLAATVDRANGETYWIADEHPYSMSEIVDTVEEVMEQEFGIRCTHKRFRLPSIVGTAAQWADFAIQATGLYEQRLHVLGEMNKTIACRIEKAQLELGYAPRFSLRQGMVESIRWCVENGQHI